MEIGSEFWLNGNRTLANKYEVPGWLQKYENVVLTSSGRGTISLILDIIKPKKKSVLLPCYTCDSVIKPFEKAGYEIFFFDISKDLKPITAGLEKLQIGVFLHMSYFGFPTNSEITDFISELQSQSVIIIEDITHSLFSEKSTFQNDFIIGSIRKWLGIPSGAFLASKEKIDIKLQDHPNAFIEKRNNGLSLKFEYIQSQESSLKDIFIKEFHEAEALLDKDFHYYKMDRRSNQEINQIDINLLREKRQTNFNYLYKHIIQMEGIEPIFSNITTEVCPLFFPVYVNDHRDQLRADLREQDIYCPVHWPISSALDGKLDQEMSNIYNSILSIPCDQRYTIKDMERVIRAIQESLKDIRKST